MTPNSIQAKAEADALAKEPVTHPSQQFERYCKPVMLNHQKSLDNLEKKVDKVASNIDELVKREDLGDLADVERDSSVRTLADRVTEASNDLRKVFYDGNGESLVGQIRSLSATVEAVAKSQALHFEDHRKASSSWRQVGQRLLGGVMLAAILGILGWAVIGAQQKFNSKAYGELTETMRELKSVSIQVRSDLEKAEASNGSS